MLAWTVLKVFGCLVLLMLCWLLYERFVIATRP
jgi:hypothetical protein